MEIDKLIEKRLLKERTAFVLHLFGVLLERNYTVKNRKYSELDTPTQRTFKAIERVMGIHGVEGYTPEEVYYGLVGAFKRFVIRLKEEAGMKNE